VTNLVTPSPQPQLLSGIASQLDAVARKHQQNIYSNIAADFGVASAVQTAGQSLTGMNLLLQAEASFALPTTFQTNNAVRASLNGDQFEAKPRRWQLRICITASATARIWNQRRYFGGYRSSVGKGYATNRGQLPLRSSRLARPSHGGDPRKGRPQLDLNGATRSLANSACTGIYQHPSSV
jgi:hypothetical protein